VRYLRACVATLHHLRGDLVAAPAEHGAPAPRVALAHVLRELAVLAEVPVLRDESLTAMQLPALKAWVHAFINNEIFDAGVVPDEWRRK
jgi:hypothetical protein